MYPRAISIVPWVINIGTIGLLLLNPAYADVVYNDGGEHDLVSTINEATYVSRGTTVNLNPNITLTGPRGYCIKNGAMYVSDSFLYANGGTISGNGDTSSGGQCPSGDAVEFRDGGGGTGIAEFYPGVVVRGGIGNGASAIALRYAGYSEVKIYGGTFMAGDPSFSASILKVQHGTVHVYGGEFVAQEKQGNYFDWDVQGKNGIIKAYGCLGLRGDRLMGILLDGTPINVKFRVLGNDARLIIEEAGSCSPSGAPSLSMAPSASAEPSRSPSLYPSDSPSDAPSHSPTFIPTQAPTSRPTAAPSESPSQFPSHQPSFEPTMTPSKVPSQEPSTLVTSNLPSFSPSNNPTTEPIQEESSSASSFNSCHLISWLRFGQFFLSSVIIAILV